MAKDGPQKVRSVEDELAFGREVKRLKKALGDPDPSVQLKASMRILELTGSADAAAQFFLPKALDNLEGYLSAADPRVRIRAAKVVLSAHDSAGMALLKSKPEVGIERARAIVRDLIERLEEEERLSPPN